MSQAQFILGGARSGKSRRALVLAERIGNKRLFIATAQAFDTEMTERIARHKTERDESWTTKDAPIDLVPALEKACREADVCVVDCLTLWLNNVMFHERNVENEIEILCNSVPSLPIPVIFVSNEIGLGLVPETALGRSFRDAQGRLNQKLAHVCNNVEFMAAGIPMTLKG